jgi:YidC/Oxa1 family membrane protein insertase
MDKNTGIGMGLILLVIIGFMYFNRPSEAQLKAQQRAMDSIAAVQQKAKLAAADKEEKTKAAQAIFDTNDPDSVKASKMHNLFGDFAANCVGTNKTVVLENSKIRVELATRGGAASKVMLKGFSDFQKKPLVLFDAKDVNFNIELPVANGKVLNTTDLYFTPMAQTDSSVTMAVNAGSDDKLLTYTYKLPKDSYMLNFSIATKNLKGLVSSVNSMKLDWNTNIKQHEKSIKFESRYAALSYKPLHDDGVEELSNTGEKEEAVTEPMRWVAFKDQFFSSVLIADGGNWLKKGQLTSAKQDEKSGYLQHYDAQMELGINPAQNQTATFRFFYGPNKYQLLKSYDKHLSGNDKLHLNRIIPLGWAIFRWVNQLAVIPMFNFFGSFISNYGIIILLMTIVIKLVLFPLTFKSYMSSAKMRVLKPEIDKMTKDIPADNQAERQQATWSIYSKAGVNPMGGCLPMLLQMPLLIAMFTFFPTSIELRGQSFLWAQDLSSYDAVVSWNANIPFISSTFGNHISLFCMLMTITNIIYTKINMSMTDTGASQQMPFMKWMMYLMPLMFLFWFNDYASGLSYYYFISLLITIILTRINFWPR